MAIFSPRLAIVLPWPRNCIGCNLFDTYNALSFGICHAHAAGAGWEIAQNSFSYFRERL